MRILGTLLCILILTSLFAAGQTSVPPSGASLTAQEIASRLAESNGRRKLALQSYTGERQYHLLYTGFPGKHEADMVVQVSYQAPADKRFTVVSESGSSLIINRVFKKLLETEKESADAESQARSAVSSDNYAFELLGKEDLNGRPSYILKVEPKTSNKLLYRGKIWVDAADFAVAKIEAEPAKRPSFWISNTVIHHTYRKVGQFWLPEQNESTTEVRLGGHAVLSIRYREYKVVPETKVSGAATLAETSGN
jgi:outer membrane lipoprotein-sorting protein